MFAEEKRRCINDALGMARKFVENSRFIEGFCDSHCIKREKSQLLVKERRNARYYLRMAKALCEREEDILVASGDEDPWYMTKEFLSPKDQAKVSAMTRSEREGMLWELLVDGQKKVECSPYSPTGQWYLSRNWLVRFNKGWYYYSKYELDC